MLCNHKLSISFIPPLYRQMKRESQTRPVNVKSLQMIDQYRSWQRLDEEWKWFNFIFPHKGRVCPRASLSLWESIHTKAKSCSVSNEQTEYIYIHTVSDIRLNLWMVHKLVMLLHLQASHINSNPRELWHTYKHSDKYPWYWKPESQTMVQIECICLSKSISSM